MINRTESRKIHRRVTSLPARNHSNATHEMAI